MPLFETHKMRPGDQLAPLDQYQVYNGLDACVTVEVLQELQRLRPEVPTIYNFERALQAPYLEIMLRGFAVDETHRRRASARIREKLARLQVLINEFAFAIWDKPLNPNSPAQLKSFFYSSMGLPEIWLSQKGERRVSTNREALEKLEERYLYARPLVSAILAFRDLSKQLNVFEMEIDSDRRIRTSYNIAGTETGRPSSSKNAFGTGGNLQNIDEELRYVFVSDPGMKLGVIDLEQVEARDVGFICGCLFDKWTFLDNCESGDLHTNNSKLVWPELPWTGEPKQDRAIADREYYRGFSYRDMAKRGGHLSNYSGTAWTASRALKVDLSVMSDFQLRYCRGPKAAYPELTMYWQWIAAKLQTSSKLSTLFGRERLFLGRPGEEATQREGIAFVPQGTTADRMNLGLWRIWKYMPEVQLLGQGFDSVTFQYSEAADEQQVLGRALELVRVELRAPNGRLYVVPGEAKVGWNWGSESQSNPLGLRKLKPGIRDDRERAPGARRIML